MPAAAPEEVVEEEEIGRDRSDFSGPPRAAEAAGRISENAEAFSGPRLTPAAAPEALRRASEAAAATRADDDGEESIKKE